MKYLTVFLMLLCLSSCASSTRSDLADMRDDNARRLGRILGN